MKVQKEKRFNKKIVIHHEKGNKRILPLRQNLINMVINLQCLKL